MASVVDVLGVTVLGVTVAPADTGCETPGLMMLALLVLLVLFVLEVVFGVELVPVVGTEVVVAGSMVLLPALLA